MGSVKALSCLYAGRCVSVREAISTFGGRGRSANIWVMAGCSIVGGMGETTLDTAGVVARDERGLFFDRGLDGAWRKSSGISFQFSIAEGTGVVEAGVRVADADLGGGGGRFTAVDTGGGSVTG